MSPDQHSTETHRETPKSFTATHWSVVLTAGQSASPEADLALEKLCRSYWYPLYVYVRREGHSPHDAQDLTQEFFARLLEKNNRGGGAPVTSAIPRAGARRDRKHRRQPGRNRGRNAPPVFCARSLTRKRGSFRCHSFGHFLLSGCRAAQLAAGRSNSSCQQHGNVRSAGLN